MKIMKVFLVFTLLILGGIVFHPDAYTFSLFKKKTQPTTPGQAQAPAAKSSFFSRKPATPAPRPGSLTTKPTIPARPAMPAKTSIFSRKPTTPAPRPVAPTARPSVPAKTSIFSRKPAASATNPTTPAPRPGSPVARPTTPPRPSTPAGGGSLFGRLTGNRPAAPAPGQPGAQQQPSSGGMLGGLLGNRPAAPAPGQQGVQQQGQQPGGGGILGKLGGFFKSAAQTVVAKAKEVGNEAILFFKALPGALKQFAIEMKNQFQKFNLNTTELRLVIKVPINPNQPDAAQGQAVQPGAQQQGIQQQPAGQARPPLPVRGQTSSASPIRR